MKGRAILPTVLTGIGLAGAAHAGEVLVTADISTSDHWTANNFYNLQTTIHVLPGATLTIDAGVIVASDTNIGGSIAVCRGAQIFVNGTATNPVIMTSKADVATWAADPSNPTGKNPKTGTWREAVNEWGNLTLMGQAYISANNHGGTTTNVPTPNASNVAPMEGLIASGPNDPNVLYGGGNDDDDSGSVTYLSLRYGGKVVALNNELNGLSMGGIGRGTTVHHIDIMNNVDDGIETWGGTVNYKFLNIWNIGDDDFDTDEGWRGKAQFGLLVKGYSRDAATGSGVGDHGCEMDGAEDSDWQPVSTNVIYNFTLVGQPGQTRGTLAWRDNNRTQFHNCIFMDGGGEVVKFDNTDGDGAHGYGFNGTLDWPTTWTTPYTSFSTVNAPPNPQDFYKSQVSGNLAEITDSVFFRNLNANAYTEATARGVFAAPENNVITPGSADASAPVTSVTRGPLVMKGGIPELPVIGIDPRPANDALVSVGTAPNDGFFTPAQYRGGFEPCTEPWIAGWTACQAFGFFTPVNSPTSYCTAKTASNGCVPTLGFVGPNAISITNASANLPANFTASNMSPKPAAASHIGQLFYSTVGPNGVAFQGGFLCVKSPIKRIAPNVNTGGTAGSTTLCDASVTQDFNARINSGLDPALVAGANVWIQAWCRDTAPFLGVQLSDAMAFTICP